MMTATPSRYRGVGRFAGRGFTLLELVVVIAILVILITVSVISVAAIAKDARLSSGRNQVLGALGNARALAMQTGKPTGVVFRVNMPDNGARQFVEAIVVRWTGETWPVISSGEPLLVNRFIAVNGVDPIQLPAGIKVAAPWYDNPGTNTDNFDHLWVTQPELLFSETGAEAAGRLLGIMFDRDGSLITSISHSASAGGASGTTGEEYVDFSNGDLDLNGNLQDVGAGGFFNYNERQDEPNIVWAPMLAVFDDDDLRENFKFGDWSASAARNAEISSYILQYADTINFNRYTGVALK